MKTRTHELKDGDGFSFHTGDHEFYLCCCDCGLIHRMEVESEEDGKTTIRMFRDKRRTTRRRKLKNIQVMEVEHAT